MIKMKWSIETSGLDFLEENADDLASMSTREAVEWVGDYIQGNWSDNAPSSPGNPPALITGGLEDSISIEQSRDGGGRFAKGWSIIFKAPYAAALEFGYGPRNLKPRPYVRPAIIAAKEVIADFFVKSYSVKSRFTGPV